MSKDKKDIDEYVRKLQDIKDKGEDSDYYLQEKNGNILIKKKSWHARKLRKLFQTGKLKR